MLIILAVLKDLEDNLDAVEIPRNGRGLTKSGMYVIVIYFYELNVNEIFINWVLLVFLMS